MEAVTPRSIDRRGAVHVARTVSHCLDEIEHNRCIANSFPGQLFLTGEMSALWI